VDIVHKLAIASFKNVQRNALMRKNDAGQRKHRQFKCFTHEFTLNSETAQSCNSLERNYATSSELALSQRLKEGTQCVTPMAQRVLLLAR
jgi:hypothetical protein